MKLSPRAYRSCVWPVVMLLYPSFPSWYGVTGAPYCLWIQPLLRWKDCKLSPILLLAFHFLNSASKTRSFVFSIVQFSSLFFVIHVLCAAVFPLTLVKIFPVGVLWFRCVVCDLLLVWICEWVVGWVGLPPTPPCTSIGANAIC